jgi:hypothetical protein
MPSLNFKQALNHAPTEYVDPIFGDRVPNNKSNFDDLDESIKYLLSTNSNTSYECVNWLLKFQQFVTMLFFNSNIEAYTFDPWTKHKNYARFWIPFTRINLLKHVIFHF